MTPPRIPRSRAAAALLAALAACAPSGDDAPVAPGYSPRRVEALWREAGASIRDAEECPMYGGLELEPIETLIPLGRDPWSGLWEFADARTGRVPERDRASGRLSLTEDSAMVMVLLPGGTTWMGAQRDDPEAPNFDPRAQPDEQPVHRVTLSPFLISKYEMTQGQWVRLTGVNTSYYQEGSEHVLVGVNLLHPIEGNSWNECREAFAPYGLRLPTEAQWEYAARGGTDTPWYCGREREELVEVANLADANAALHGGPKDWDYVEWVDDWVMHAPVGSLRPNAFGLHDVLGNLWEWCRDAYRPDFYEHSPERDPVCEDADAPRRVRRGGGFNGSDRGARVANRQDREPDGDGRALGCRPVIELPTH